MVGDDAAIRHGHLARRAMQVARPRVIAEPGPPGQDVVERRGRQRAHRGKARQPLLEVGDDCLGARLLQHDLADPNGVRIARSPPGQISMTAAIPADERSTDSSGTRGRRHPPAFYHAAKKRGRPVTEPPPPSTTNYRRAY